MSLPPASATTLASFASVRVPMVPASSTSSDTSSADPFAGLRLPTALAAKERAIALVELAQRIAAYAGLRLGEIQSLTAERVTDTTIEVVTGYDPHGGVRPRPKTPARQRPTLAPTASS